MGNLKEIAVKAYTDERKKEREELIQKGHREEEQRIAGLKNVLVSDLNEILGQNVAKKEDIYEDTGQLLIDIDDVTFAIFYESHREEEGEEMEKFYIRIRKPGTRWINSVYSNPIHRIEDIGKTLMNENWEFSKRRYEC